jgi:hypothetical protein
VKDGLERSYGLIVEGEYTLARHEFAKQGNEGFDARHVSLLRQFWASFHALPSSEKTADSGANEVKELRGFFMRTLQLYDSTRAEAGETSYQVANEEDPGDDYHQRGIYPFGIKAVAGK